MILEMILKCIVQLFSFSLLIFCLGTPLNMLFIRWNSNIQKDKYTFRKIKKKNVKKTKMLSDNDISRKLQLEHDIRYGAAIGFLERILIALPIVYVISNNVEASKSITTIAVTITLLLSAKTLTRFKRIELDQEFAEKYLLGTLFSIVSTIFITLFIYNLFLPLMLLVINITL